MRKLMWFAVGFAAACGLFTYVLPAGVTGTVLFAAAAGGVVTVLAGKRRRYQRIALVLLGCALGSFWYGEYHSRYLAAPAALEGQIRTAVIRTTDYGEMTDSGTVIDGIITLEEKPYRIRLWLDREEPLGPGYQISGSVRFGMTAPAEDPVSWYSGNGVFLLAFQEDALQIEADTRILWLDRVAQLRKWLKGALHGCFPADAEGFARALLLGDTSLIDYETDTAFKVSGIRHVIAVSGLHVSILVAILSAVTFRKRALTVPVGLGVLFIFAALAGFSPSVTRACLMSGLLLLAMLFDREYDGATALSFAVLVMLTMNPLTIASVSFQLSVASVAGIYLIDPRLRPWLLEQLPDPGAVKWKRHLTKWFSASVSITLSAMALTTPLCAYYFGMVSLVGVVTNLFALWIVSGIFYGIIAVCLLYAMGLSVGAVLGRLLAWPIRYVLTVARLMADIPLAAVYMDSVYSIAWLIFVYILLAAFLMGKQRSAKLLLCCGSLSLCVALFASRAEGKTATVTVLDVGQGQCILLQSEGRTYMVDCGGDSDSRTADIAANHLLSRGISRLDGLILTHLDRDHAGAAANLLTRIDVDLLVLPAEHTELTAEATLYCDRDLQLGSDDLEITVYAPTFPGTGNEKSLCVLFDTKKCDILITGDRDAFGERMLLRTSRLPEVDILIAGHHGSKFSTCEELLKAVSPDTVCISAGEDNPYGHPAQELLRRLADFGCTVYRTDLHGTIILRR